MKSPENTKKGIITALVTCAVVFVVFYTIINIGVISGVVSSLMSLVSPVLIGFAIAYMLNPILRLFEFKIYKKIQKKSVLRALSIISTYVVALLIIIFVIWLLVPSLITAISDLVSNYDNYISKTSDLINNVINWVMSKENVAEYVDDTAVKNIIANFFSFSGSALDSIMKYIAEYGMGLFVGIKNTFLGIFISIYVLISKEKLQAQFRKFGAAIFSDSRQRKIGRYINLTHHTFSSYFVGKILAACLVFVLMFVLMLIFRLEYPLLISTIVAVTDIIPIFGPIIGAIPSFFILFIVDPKQALIFVVLILLVNNLEGNVISPKILGEATGISSLSVIIAIIVMGDLFGILGMIVGVPVFAVGITVIKEVVDTRLRKKGKSIDTADYYLKDSVVDPYEHHEPIMMRINRNIKKQCEKIAGVFKKNIEKSRAESAKDKEEASEQSADEKENINKETKD